MEDLIYLSKCTQLIIHTKNFVNLYLCVEKFNKCLLSSFHGIISKCVLLSYAANKSTDPLGGW